MAEKNKVVDDYYSNISDESSDKKEKVAKKVTPVKKKIVIKKANWQEQVESKPKETHLKVAKKSPKKVESSNDIKKQEKEAKKTEKKKIIQKITVIKKEDRVTTLKGDS